MAKLKLKLDDYEYIEGTPEELATFMKIVGKQPPLDKAIEVKNVGIDKELKISTTEGTATTNSLIEESKDVEIMSYNLPIEDDVINFITSKELFEHNTTELQEKFLGKRLPVRENPALYSAFDNIVRKARKHIAEKYNGIWDNRATKSYGRRTHVTVYKFKKSTDEPASESLFELSDSSDNLSVQKPIPLSDFKRKESEII